MSTPITISRYVARDAVGTLRTFWTCPKRYVNHWGAPGDSKDILPMSAFPEITWEGGPVRVLVTITKIEE